MHLPSQPDAFDTRAQIGGQAQHGSLSRAPPVGGILFGPQIVQARDGERRAGLRQNHATRRSDDRFYARSANIDAQIHADPIPLCLSALIAV